MKLLGIIAVVFAAAAAPALAADKPLDGPVKTAKGFDVSRLKKTLQPEE